MGDVLLPTGTAIGPLGLRVSDLERSLQFYQHALGFAPLAQSEGSVTLGSAGEPLLTLEHRPNAPRRPARTTGLYHFAVLMPTRAALGRSMQRLAELRYPLQGGSDHLVSEALYLADPEGNGIELYRDRPREEWPRRDGQIVMDNAPLDVAGILEEAEQSGQGWTGLDAGTRIGHMHLQISNTAQARAFYCDLLGFELQADWRGAIFVSAGGYHHHLGLNTWETAGGTPPPADALGLSFFTVLLPDQATLAAASERLQGAGVEPRQVDGGLAVRDPWNNDVRLVVQS
jgi:catechol 2,3-dioxygenase